jgi:hypothetical protein
MPRHTRITLLVLALLVVYGTLLPRVAASRLPGNDQGYSPPQPIAYSHRLHAGEMQMPCLYCHTAAERGRHAGIPSADVCMNCHEAVRATLGAVRAEAEAAEAEKREPRPVVSAALRTLYDALALDENLKPDPARTPTAIRWMRVHRLPDFASFDHSRHVTAGVTCQRCHGPVETMERVRQYAPLRMGWCVDCHREANVWGVAGKPMQASLDCAACHH